MRYMALVFLALFVLELPGRGVHGQIELDTDEQEITSRQVMRAVKRVMDKKMEEIEALLAEEREVIISAIIEQINKDIEPPTVASESSDGELLALIRAGKVKSTCIRRAGIGAAGSWAYAMTSPDRLPYFGDEFLTVEGHEEKKSGYQWLGGISGWCEEYKFENIE